MKTFAIVACALVLTACAHSRARPVACEGQWTPINPPTPVAVEPAPHLSEEVHDDVHSEAAP